jgi:hypothetical protein
LFSLELIKTIFVFAFERINFVNQLINHQLLLRVSRHTLILTLQFLLLLIWIATFLFFRLRLLATGLPAGRITIALLKLVKEGLILNTDQFLRHSHHLRLRGVAAI